MNLARYFDNAATTPIDPRVFAAMRPWLESDFGNANSIHAWGLKARDAVERAREQVAEAIGADDPSEVVFTSGATEANNWLLAAHPGACVSPIEHSSIWEQIGPRNLRVIPPLEGEGGASPRLGGQQSELGRGFGLVSLMRVNNETGAVYHAPDAELIHTDATQAVGKLTFDVNTPGVDFASLSAHKFHGPKGIGALYARNASFPPPLLIGGEQESGHRAGTLNVAAIVGLGEAIRIAAEDRQVIDFQEIVLNQLDKTSDWHMNGLALPPGVARGAFPLGKDVSPYILSLSFLGLEGETIVLELDRRGFAISSGAACSSRSNEPSHVLTALGYPPEWLRGTIRISFGRFNTIDEAANLGKALAEVARNLRNLA